MKRKQFDWSFKVRDIDKTKLKHAYQINKLKGVKFDDVMESEWVMENNIPSAVVSLPIWNWGWIRDEIKEHGRTQKNIKLVKSLINQETRKYIQDNLEFNNLPKSYDTAFYCKFYNRINRIMSRMARQLI